MTDHPIGAVRVSITHMCFESIFLSFCTIVLRGVCEPAFNRDLQIVMSFRAGLRGTKRGSAVWVTTTGGGLGRDAALQVGRAAAASGALSRLWKKGEGRVAPVQIELSQTQG